MGSGICTLLFGSEFPEGRALNGVKGYGVEKQLNVIISIVTRQFLQGRIKTQGLTLTQYISNISTA